MPHDSYSGGQIFWIWPLRFSRTVRRRVDTGVLSLNRLIATPARLLACAVLIGVLPVLLSVSLSDLLSVSLQIPLDRPLTTLAATPLLLAAVRHDSLRRGFAFLSLVFVAHSTATIWLTASDPERLAEHFPPGQAYWIESRDWIRTGVSPEYELGYWLPAHLMQFAGGVVFTLTSLGAILIWEGLYQVDLMNVYVGNLVRHSSSPLLALALGWHPWSLLRGIGFLFVGFEVSSLSLERFLSRSLSTRKARLWRWGCGIGFLALDAVVKFFCLGAVRDVLHGNLLPSGQGIF